ncbi:MAG: aspartate aminotransferase family protein [Verrucomicrobia bacterium]|nr:MAG: aspartate aminotransferase family protein [Verrucomicrobiota bacterium]
MFERNVVPSYARFDLVLERGEGSYVWDVDGSRYLDMGGGIAVCLLGHAHAEIADALHFQARKLTHVSNLYYHELQGRLAEALVDLIAPGRVFFCSSGAEANEGLFKLARKFGHEKSRYEIITALGSFHGRTLAGIAATGQDKVKKGFEPAVVGFKHVPFNDLEAVKKAIGPNTAAVLIEPIQGESGITVASKEYLLGLRRLCDEHGILLMFDEVQAGHFRTGKFQSWQTIVGDSEFLPDAVSMAKSLGGGFPIGAFWVKEDLAQVLSAGTHATTFGGTPLGCAVALKILEIVRRDQLAENARELGEFLKSRLQSLQKEFPRVLREVRGFGLMIGLDFFADAPGFTSSDEFPGTQTVKRLHSRGLLAIPAATAVVRLLPALNLSRGEAEEALEVISGVVSELA